MTDTKSSMSAVQPDAKPTVAMAPPPSWAIALSEKVSNGFQSVDARLTTIEGNQTLQGGQVLDIGRRMTEMERRVGGMEDRQTTNSVRVKSTTDENLKQDSAIATLVVDVAGLKTSQAAQTKHLETLVDGGKALMKNPKFLLLLAALYAYAMSWLGKHGGVP